MCLTIISAKGREDTYRVLPQEDGAFSPFLLPHLLMLSSVVSLGAPMQVSRRRPTQMPPVGARVASLSRRWGSLQTLIH